MASQEQQPSKQVLVRTTAQKRRSSLNRNDDIAGLKSSPATSNVEAAPQTDTLKESGAVVNSRPRNQDAAAIQASPGQRQQQQQQQQPQPVRSSPAYTKQDDYIEEKNEIPPPSSKTASPQKHNYPEEEQPSTSRLRNDSLTTPTNNKTSATTFVNESNRHISKEEEGEEGRRSSLSHVPFATRNDNKNRGEEEVEYEVDDDVDYIDKRDQNPRRSSLTASNGRRQTMEDYDQQQQQQLRPTRRAPKLGSRQHDDDDENAYDGESEHSSSFKRQSDGIENPTSATNHHPSRPRRASSQGSSLASASSSNGNRKPFARPRRQSRPKYTDNGPAPMPEANTKPTKTKLLTVSMVKSNSNLAEEKKEATTCTGRMAECYRTSPFCPSATRALELFAISLDGLAVVFLALSMVVPWVTSVAPCSDCPQEFSSTSFLTDRGLRATYGLFSAGSLSNPQFLPVSDYFNVVNTTSSLVWAQNYSQYFFPPQANIFWQDLSSNLVCSANTPGYLLWGLPFGMCPYNVPGPAMGSQAFGILATIFAGFSMFSMIAARRGRSGFAQCSTLCSVLSAGFGLGAVLYFSLWSYNREHVGLGQGTIPIPAVSRSGEFSQTMIVPVNANFGWDAGYYLGIVSIAFECISTLISWIAGTEKCLWTPDSDVVYGPDSWIYGANYETYAADPNNSVVVQVVKKRRPTLQELAQQPTHDVAIV